MKAVWRTKEGTMGLFKEQRGFTLVELLVVVVIIGILVAIAIPIYNTVTEAAQERACHANLRVIDGAISMWQMEDTGRIGNAPAALQDLSGYIDDVANVVCPSDGDYDLAGDGKSSCSEHGSYGQN